MWHSHSWLCSSGQELRGRPHTQFLPGFLVKTERARSALRPPNAWMVVVPVAGSPLCHCPLGMKYSPPRRDSLTINDRRVAASHNDHVFVVVAYMRCGNHRLAASPKRHLADVGPVKDVTFHSRRLPGCWLQSGSREIS
jgi:hypothetical protein